MSVLYIDCRQIRTESQFWDAYARAVGPEAAELFGRNLDAFNDAMQGGPGYPGAGVSIRLGHSQSLAPLKEGTFLRHLRDIAHGCNSPAVDLTFE